MLSFLASVWELEDESGYVLLSRISVSDLG